MHSNEEFWKIFIDVQKFEKFDGNTWRTSKNHVRSEIFNDRIYGGQLVAQSYIIAKSLFSEKYLSKIETNFIGPGIALEAMDYHVENLPNDLSEIIVKQNGKFISKSFLRFDEVPQSLIENVHVDENLHTNIQHPTSYCEMEELLNNPDINNYPKEHRLFIESVCSLKLFEVRPINLNNFNGLNSECRYSWCRLIPEVRDLELNDPVFVLLFLSDWLINEPAILLYDNLRPSLYKNYSSLNHKMWIHTHDFDPKGYFLYSVSCDIVAKKHALIKGKIYDENKRCLATFVQDSFIEENE